MSCMFVCIRYAYVWLYSIIYCLQYESAESAFSGIMEFSWRIHHGVIVIKFSYDLPKPTACTQKLFSGCAPSQVCQFNVFLDCFAPDQDDNQPIKGLIERSHTKRNRIKREIFSLYHIVTHQVPQLSKWRFNCVRRFAAGTCY